METPPLRERSARGVTRAGARVGKYEKNVRVGVWKGGEWAWWVMEGVCVGVEVSGLVSNASGWLCLRVDASE